MTNFIFIISQFLTIRIEAHGNLSKIRAKTYFLTRLFGPVNEEMESDKNHIKLNFGRNVEVTAMMRKKSPRLFDLNFSSALRGGAKSSFWVITCFLLSVFGKISNKIYSELNSLEEWCFTIFS